MRYKDIKECFLWGMGSTGLLMNSELKSTQWFKGRLTLNPGLNLTRVSFPFVQKHFMGQFFLLFFRLQNSRHFFFSKSEKKKVKCGVRVLHARNTDCFAM